jgi:hypothetical protein
VANPTVDRLIENKFARYALDGFSISGTLSAQTGLPLTGFMAAAPASLISDGGLTGAELSLFNSGTNGRVPDIAAARNAFPGPGVHNVDARVSRSFPLHESISLQLWAEAFNLTNHKNILGVNTNLYNWIGSGLSSVTSSGSVVCPTSSTGGCIVPLASSSAQFGTQNSTSAVLYGPRQLQLSAKLFF